MIKANDKVHYHFHYNNSNNKSKTRHYAPSEYYQQYLDFLEEKMNPPPLYDLDAEMEKYKTCEDKQSNMTEYMRCVLEFKRAENVQRYKDCTQVHRDYVESLNEGLIKELFFESLLNSRKKVYNERNQACLDQFARFNM